MDYLEIGALFSFPLGNDRPPWLPLTQLAIRIQVPVAEYGRWEQPVPDAAR
jgi:hypothetical protein